MPATQDDIDLMSLLSALRSNLWRILGTAFVVGALTYGGLSLVPPTFKSTAQVILEPSARGLLRPQGQEAANVDLKVDESEVSSQAEVMRSRDLLSKVAATEHLDQHPEFNPAPAGQGVLGRVLSMFSGVPSGLEPRERALLILEQSVRVTEVPRTRLISIDATSHDPALAASIANAVAMAYLERNRASQVKTASDTTTYIGSNIAEVKAQAEAAESALERFRAESGLLSGRQQRHVEFTAAIGAEHPADPGDCRPHRSRGARPHCARHDCRWSSRRLGRYRAIGEHAGTIPTEIAR